MNGVPRKKRGRIIKAQFQMNWTSVRKRMKGKEESSMQHKKINEDLKTKRDTSN